MKRLLTYLLCLSAFSVNADLYNKNQNMEEGWALLYGSPMAVSQAPQLPGGMVMTSIREVEGYPSVILNTYQECPTPEVYDINKAQIGQTWVNMISVCSNDKRVVIGAKTKRGADFIVQRLVKSNTPVVLNLQTPYSILDISIPATNFKQALDYFREKELNAL
ncbi:hypothetical protein [Vibrio parahaemolyticus]|uniref:hypothetical protein n=1 Tax=Vibrio parahaemolyticus TaxID=670 RepID=UPI0023613F74|nr:hypothetical protein [Vibrio parahaemolyticus]